MTAIATLYHVLRDLGEAGYRVRIRNGAVQVVGSPPLSGPLLDRVRAAKPTLLGCLESWKPGDDVLTWPDRVFEAYAREVADLAPVSLVPSTEIYQRYRAYNVVVVEGANIRSATLAPDSAEGQ